VEVINQVSIGAMPKETAVNILKAAFPAFSEQQIVGIIQPIEPGSVTADGQVIEKEQTATGEMASVSTLQFKRNRKAIETILGELSQGVTTEAKARVYLASIGLTETSINALIADALDGSGKLESVDGQV
jgi:hypothetical protein